MEKYVILLPILTTILMLIACVCAFLYITTLPFNFESLICIVGCIYIICATYDIWKQYYKYKQMK